MLVWNVVRLQTVIQSFLGGGWRRVEQTRRKDPYKGTDESEGDSRDWFDMSYALEEGILGYTVPREKTLRA